MEVVVKSNNAVRLNFLCLLLRDAGLDPVVFDSNMAVLEGSAGAIQCRLAVPGAQVEQARRILREVGEA